MVKCGVLFEVRVGFLNIIQTIFGFKGLKSNIFPPDVFIGLLTDLFA
jgi:hypothetical protein